MSQGVWVASKTHSKRQGHAFVEFLERNEVSPTL